MTQAEQIVLLQNELTAAQERIAVLEKERAMLVASNDEAWAVTQKLQEAPDGAVNSQ